MDKKKYKSSCASRDYVKMLDGTDDGGRWLVGTVASSGACVGTCGLTGSFGFLMFPRRLESGPSLLLSRLLLSDCVLTGAASIFS